MQWSMKEKTAARLGLADLILLIVAVLSYRSGSGLIETTLIDRLGWGGWHAAQL